MKNRNRKVALALTLCFTLALGMSAFAEGTVATAPESAAADVTSTNNQDSQYEDAGNMPIAIAVTTEQAIQIVKNQLKADETWTVEVVELNEENGVMTYKVIATNAMNDACCRLVNAATGEMTSVNLWLESNDKQKDDNEDGESKGKKDDGKDKKKDGKKSADDQNGDNADNNDNNGDSTDAGEADTGNADNAGATDNGGNAAQDTAQTQN